MKSLLLLSFFLPQYLCGDNNDTSEKNNDDLEQKKNDTSTMFFPDFMKKYGHTKENQDFYETERRKSTLLALAAEFKFCADSAAVAAKLQALKQRGLVHF